MTSRKLNSPTFLMFSHLKNFPESQSLRYPFGAAHLLTSDDLPLIFSLLFSFSFAIADEICPYLNISPKPHAHLPAQAGQPAYTVVQPAMEWKADRPYRAPAAAASADYVSTVLCKGMRVKLLLRSRGNFNSDKNLRLIFRNNAAHRDSIPLFPLLIRDFPTKFTLSKML